MMIWANNQQITYIVIQTIYKIIYMVTFHCFSTIALPNFRSTDLTAIRINLLQIISYAVIELPYLL